jgi:hypothetical protein
MAMNQQAHVVVEPRPNGRWAVQTNGTQRAVRVFDTQSAAITDARTRARNRGAELVVKDQQGRIQSRDSHGQDDRSIKG